MFWVDFHEHEVHLALQWNVAFEVTSALKESEKPCKLSPSVSRFIWICRPGDATGQPGPRAATSSDLGVDAPFGDAWLFSRERQVRIKPTIRRF